MSEYAAWPVIFDISRPITRDLPVWPGDPKFELEWTSLIDRGDLTNVALIRMGVHGGTHLDAPHHLINGGVRVDEIPLEACVGKANVVDALGQPSIDSAFMKQVLDRNPDPHRLLFRTGAWHGGDGFPEVFPAIAPDAAALAREAGVVLIGTDAPSVDPFDSTELAAHRELLGSGICILENLLLDEVPAGEYELIALPLRIVGADASPVRAVLRTL